jgi:hypothetical protein
VAHLGTLETDVSFSWDAQRADEIGKVEPKVAYYCRMYAVEQARPAPAWPPKLGFICWKICKTIF